MSADSRRLRILHWYRAVFISKIVRSPSDPNQSNRARHLWSPSDRRVRTRVNLRTKTWKLRKVRTWNPSHSKSRWLNIQMHWRLWASIINLLRNTRRDPNHRCHSVGTLKAKCRRSRRDCISKFRRTMRSIRWRSVAVHSRDHVRKLALEVRPRRRYPWTKSRRRHRCHIRPWSSINEPTNKNLTIWNWIPRVSWFSKTRKCGCRLANISRSKTNWKECSRLCLSGKRLWLTSKRYSKCSLRRRRSISEFRLLRRASTSISIISAMLTYSVCMRTVRSRQMTRPWGHLMHHLIISNKYLALRIISPILLRRLARLTLSTIRLRKADCQQEHSPRKDQKTWSCRYLAKKTASTQRVLCTSKVRAESYNQLLMISMVPNWRTWNSKWAAWTCSSIKPRRFSKRI